jgi:hypothetical protein
VKLQHLEEVSGVTSLEFLISYPSHHFGSLYDLLSDFTICSSFCFHFWYWPNKSHCPVQRQGLRNTIIHPYPEVERAKHQGTNINTVQHTLFPGAWRLLRTSQASHCAMNRTEHSPWGTVAFPAGPDHWPLSHKLQVMVPRHPSSRTPFLGKDPLLDLRIEWLSEQKVLRICYSFLYLVSKVMIFSWQSFTLSKPVLNMIRKLPQVMIWTFRNPFSILKWTPFLPHFVCFAAQVGNISIFCPHIKTFLLSSNCN